VGIEIDFELIETAVQPAPHPGDFIASAASRLPSTNMILFGYLHRKTSRRRASTVLATATRPH
jgi:hypothetical protein